MMSDHIRIVGSLSVPKISTEDLRRAVLKGQLVPFPSGPGFRLAGVAKDKAGQGYIVWQVTTPQIVGAKP